MWLFIKSLFMVRDRRIAQKMVAHRKVKTAPAGFKLARIQRRKSRRNRFSAHNTTLQRSRVN